MNPNAAAVSSSDSKRPPTSEPDSDPRQRGNRRGQPSRHVKRNHFAEQTIQNMKSSRKDSQRLEGGESVVQTIVATRQGYDHLGLALGGRSVSAYGFNKAKIKRSMGDGP